MPRRWDQSKPPRGPWTLNKDCFQAQNLVAFWPMGGASGGNYIADYAGSNPLTTFGATRFRRGFVGEAVIETAGTSDYARSATVPVTTVPLTIDAWFRPASTSGLQEVVQLANASPVTSAFAIVLNYPSAGDLTGQKFSGAANTLPTTTTQPIQNGWNHATLIATAADVSIYLNGGSGATTAAVHSPVVAEINIGRAADNTGYFIGQVGAVCIRDVAIGASRLALISDPAARFELWYPLRSRKWISIGGGAAVSGTIATTEANDTLAATGAVLISGTLAATEAADTMAAAGIVLVTGTLASTEANDTLAATGAVVVTGTLAATEAADTCSASGQVSSGIAGSIAATEAADTLVAAGGVVVAGGLASTEAADTLAASGTVAGGLITGTLAMTEAADTMAAIGSNGVVGTPGDWTLTAARLHTWTLRATSRP